MTTPTTVPVRLKLRQDTAANWTSVNPVLLAGELGRESDTGKIKIGNGSSTWTALAYQAWATLPVAVSAGGTGQTTYTNGQLLIGNTTGNTLTKATLTAGSGVAITNGTGSITVAASNIADAQISASAAIVDTKLATIATAGKVSNSATTADSANTANAIVARDASGNFSAGTITAALTGAASSNVLKAGDTMTGALVVPLASASTPSLTFTGDLDTGVFSPGADQVAVATNGSGRLFVNASGRVGIGVESPAATLHITGFNTVGGIKVVDSNTALAAPGIEVIGKRSDVNTSSCFAGKLLLSKNRTDAVIQSTNVLGSVAFGGNHTDGTEANILYSASIVGTADGAFNSATDMPTALVFNTGATGRAPDTANVTTGTERLRITSAGNVGIGTSAPWSASTVFGQGTPGDVASARQLSVGASSTYGVSLGYYQTGAAQPFAGVVQALDNNVGTRLLLNPSGGNVGIGTTSPGVALHVDGDIRADGIYGETDTNTSIQFPGSDVITFNEGGSEAARIDSSGRLLVGTSSALGGFGYAPQVQQIGATTSTASSLLHGTGTTVFPTFSRINAGSTAVANNDRILDLRVYGYDGTNYIQAAKISADVDGTPGTNDMPGRLVFSTTADGASSPTERMRIQANGSILFGTTNEAGVTSGTVNGKVIEAGSIMRSSRPTTDAASHIVFYNTNGLVGQISTSASATAYNTSSDYRLKENVAPVTDGITRLQQLKPSRFNFIADPDIVVDGFIAHEVQTIVPEAITGEKDAVDEEGNPEYQGIDQSKLVPLLTAALQEAIAKIEVLEQRLNDAGIN